MAHIREELRFCARQRDRFVPRVRKRRFEFLALRDVDHDAENAAIPAREFKRGQIQLSGKARLIPAEEGPIAGPELRVLRSFVKQLEARRHGLSDFCAEFQRDARDLFGVMENPRIPLPHHLFGGVAEHALRASVPAQKEPIGTDPRDRHFAGRLNHRLQHCVRRGQLILRFL